MISAVHMTIEINDLRFSYKDTAVLKGISFQASEGSLLCVLGRNGAGKSTLFRCILGLLKGYSGEIVIDGIPASDFPTKDLAGKIAYIPQNHSSVFSFSVFDMVMMGTTAGLGRFKNPGRSQRAAAEAALEMINIGHLRNRDYCRISGGEQQMVLIARAIAQQTRIIIMDEPCSNLDYGNQIKVLKTIKTLAKQGYLIIQSTHNPEHVFLFSDEVLVITEGIVKAKGRADKILTKELLKLIYGIDINVHDIAGRNLKLCVPDEKEVSYVEAI